MIGQKHYAIADNTDPERPRYWRSRGGPGHPAGWVYDLLACRHYRRPDDALRAARQLTSDPGTNLEVVELETVVARACHRISILELATELPNG